MTIRRLAPADPNKGVGFMKGHILANPVRFIDTWRLAGR